MKSNLQKTVKYCSFFFKSVLMTVIAFVWAMGIQAQEVQWKKNFGGNANDTYTSVTAVSDGFVAVGYSVCDNLSCSFRNGDWIGIDGKGGQDAIIVKYNNAGNVVWKKNYGENGSDYYQSVIAVADGVIAVGNSYTVPTLIDGYTYANAIIVKYDDNGNIVWEKNFGGNIVSGPSRTEYFNSITAVVDGIVAVGRSESLGTGDWEGFTDNGFGDATVVKFDNDGNIVWKKNFGGHDYDEFRSVTTVSDGVVAVGYSYPQCFGTGDWTGIAGKGGYDATIVKFDNDGDVVWKKSFGGSNQVYTNGISTGDYFNDITTVSDGVVAVGYSKCDGHSQFGYICEFGTGDWAGFEGKGEEDGIIVKYDNNGNIVWKKNFGGAFMDWFYSIATVSDGVVAVGRSDCQMECSFGNGDWEGVTGKAITGGDAIIVKFDNEGNVVEKNNFGGIGNTVYSQYNSVTVVSDAIVSVGYSSCHPQTCSFGTGDLTGLTGKGGSDAIIVKYANNNNTDTNEITLSQLSVSAGTLNPAFSPEVYSYTVHVANSVSSIDIMATPTSQGATISGAGTLPLNVGANPFTITVTEEEKPAQNYTITVYRAGKTGISETETGKIKIYPNPVKNELRIENGELTINKITIADVSGKSIQQINGSQKQINVSALSSGIYFMKIETDKGIVTRKLIKE